MSHSTNFHPLKTFRQRKIHIQTDALRQAFFQHPLRYPAHIRPQRFEVGVRAMVTQRVGHRGDILHTPFHHHAHRTGIVGIHRGVVAMVDTTQHQVGLSRAQLSQRHLHTVRRCAVTRPYLHASLFSTLRQQQRCRRRESTRHAAPRPVRCTNQHIAQVADHVYQFIDSLGPIAIIVRYQYQRSHLFVLIFLQRYEKSTKHVAVSRIFLLSTL